MSKQFSRLGWWRWDLISITGLSFIWWLLITPASAYFLQIDTATQNLVALAWSQGCWEVMTEKMVAVVLLTPLFIVFGPSPYWEVSLLAISATITLVVAYELTRLFTKSKTAGLVSALLSAALPAFTFFSHTYLGYVAPCLLLGWLAVYKERWGLAGLGFGLAIIAHFNSLVPVALATIFLFINFRRTVHWAQWLKFALGGLLPWLVTEALFYFYLGGAPTHWLRSVLHFTLGYANSAASDPHPNWFWVIETLRDSNGWLLTGLLGLALGSIYVLWINKVGRSFAIAFLSLVLVYTVQAGIGRSWLVPRLLASAYPAWVVLSVVTFSWLVNRLTPPKRVAIQIFAGLVMAGFIIQTGVFTRNFIQTLYPTVAAWIQRAKLEDRPVRFMGNSFMAVYFAQAHGVELLANDARWLQSNAPGEAILIFANEAPTHLEGSNYSIETISLPSPPDSVYPALTYEAARPTRFELWWPRRSSLPVKPSTPPDIGVAGLYYPGQGCLTPPPYRNGTMWFYQLVIDKVIESLSWR